ncbi:carboxylesterase/lipase family protein [Rhodococcus rhodnii]|uniref:Carboxylic ester hydrolase n=2 Tax=Rhodococcus rhodnii TaxID=38312 RepID=R7WI74_9NOCA|nr:carboxylesterase/lipase family protein [Rhodococcus rhodnii]EOM74876.1 carboxylesterase [Rhodococcus rhodnii LMG 5362]TXG91673.1 carboxylesterase/lipase family protein [Rhodococcus rhodnii]
MNDTDSLVARTRAGPVRGEVAGDLRVWRGIPFAASTAGEGRFRAPEPREPWRGIRDCTRFGPIAPQGTGVGVQIDPETEHSEDCLSLNVWAPPPGPEPYPVMVWIHGGAYGLGSGSQVIYDGTELARRGEVVVVTINYRLGPLGFLDPSGFGDADSHYETNCGLRDQLSALWWVRGNIASFGGDPHDVTVFGESSGGASITTLMTCPAAAHAFDRAIAQSPPATSVYGADRAREVTRRFLDLLELGDASRLRDVPVDDLVAAGDALLDEVPSRIPGTLAFAPVVDRVFLPWYPVAAFQKGRAHRIPLVIGSNRDEASIFRFMKSALLPVTAESVRAMLDALAVDSPEIGRDRLEEILASYPDPASPKGALAVSRDAAFRMPAIWVADAHSRYCPTWVYRFDHATPMLRAARVGAAHATELPYVFGNFGTLDVDPTFWLGGRRSALEVSARVQRRWTSFAHNGTPTALDGSTHWAPYTTDERATLLVDAQDALALDPDREMREAWGTRVVGFR